MMLEPTTLSYDSRHVMAIVNVTPDSFYVTSRSVTYDDVLKRVQQAILQGATIIDIGGYSSRPGAAEVSIEDEWQRVELGLRAVAAVESGVVVSIDTFRSDIVRRAVEHFGAVIVNDISAGELDPGMVATVAELGLTYVAMHMRGNPQSMQQLTYYDKGVVCEVVDYFRARIAYLESCGIHRKNIIIDPGFGFAKSVSQNMELMSRVSDIVALGCRVLVGVSRKSMIYKPLGITAEHSLPGSLALGWEALRQGASILRVHDAEPTRQIVDLYNHFSQSI